MRYQLDIKKGDTVEVIAISTTDEWHAMRHYILFREFYVDSNPKRATQYQDYSYRNWMQANLIAVDPLSAPRKINVSGNFHFKRVQIRKVKVKKKEFPAVMTAREKMLDKINAELNHSEPTPKKKTKVTGGPQNNRDKKAWKRMFDAGYAVQAFDPAGSREWYTPNIATFQTNTPRKFRIKPKEQ